MGTTLRMLFRDRPTRRRLGAVYALLIGANVGAWLWAWLAFSDRPAFFQMAVLAYVLGLRHAVDADHIAAIDNTVRKLMQEGRQPFTAGLWFSLGHSSVVLLATAAIAVTAAAAASRFDGFRELGGVIGTSVSGAFLIAIGVANLGVLRSVWASFRRARGGLRPASEDLDLLLVGSSGLVRLLRRLFALVTRSWHLFPLGFLFGLGFDTATEIALFAVASSQASSGLPLVYTMIFPVLFTVGMALVDTTDSVLMVGAYGWAFVNPIRKLWYNLTITSVSVVVAFVIGGLEVLGLLGEKLQLGGSFWRAVLALNDDLEGVGFILVGLFLAIWAGSFLIFRWGRLDETPQGQVSQG